MNVFQLQFSQNDNKTEFASHVMNTLLNNCYIHIHNRNVRCLFQSWGHFFMFCSTFSYNKNNNQYHKFSIFSEFCFINRFFFISYLNWMVSIKQSLSCKFINNNKYCNVLKTFMLLLHTILFPSVALELINFSHIPSNISINIVDANNKNWRNNALTHTHNSTIIFNFLIQDLKLTLLFDI